MKKINSQTLILVLLSFFCFSSLESNSQQVSVIRRLTANIKSPASVTITSPGDEDDDGVTDEFDECPHTPANVEVDPYGCPINFK